MVCYRYMRSSISTVTSKFQVTLPEEVRKQFQVDIGEKIQWEVQGDILVGKRLPSLMDMAGALKSSRPTASGEEMSKSWGTAGAARDKRIKNQK